MLTQHLTNEVENTMNASRRNMLSVTAAGLIHVTANPKTVVGDEASSSDLLIRQATERGHTDLGWLKSFHSFSFGGYYDQRHMGFRSLRVISDNKVTSDQKTNQWNFIAGPDDSGAAVGIYQDAKIFASKLQTGVSLDFTLERDRHAWLQVAMGEVSVNGTTLKAGDAVASSRATSLHVTASQPSDVLLFDLA